MLARSLTTILVVALAANAAHAQGPAAPDEPVAPEPPPYDPPTEAQPEPQPTPEPSPETPVAPQPEQQTTATTETPQPSSGDYYSRQRGMGMFHKGRVGIGGYAGEQPALMGAPARGNTDAARSFSIEAEYTDLSLRTQLGNYVGYEVSVGIRTNPGELFFSIGSAVTFLNVGHGGPGSLRLGGGFGIGDNVTYRETHDGLFKHYLLYAYFRARAAIVVIPNLVDAELNARWVPPSAIMGGSDERDVRLSFWIRRGSGRTAFEGYAQWFRRQTDDMDSKREFIGIGGGIGLAF